MVYHFRPGYSYRIEKVAITSMSLGPECSAVRRKKTIEHVLSAYLLFFVFIWILWVCILLIYRQIYIVPAFMEISLVFQLSGMLEYERIRSNNKNILQLFCVRAKNLHMHTLRIHENAQHWGYTSATSKAKNTSTNPRWELCQLRDLFFLTHVISIEMN